VTESQVTNVQRSVPKTKPAVAAVFIVQRTTYIRSKNPLKKVLLYFCEVFWSLLSLPSSVVVRLTNITDLSKFCHDKVTDWIPKVVAVKLHPQTLSLGTLALQHRLMCEKCSG